jgi:hypothetical protein
LPLGADRRHREALWGPYSSTSHWPQSLTTRSDAHGPKRRRRLHQRWRERERESRTLQDVATVGSAHDPVAMGR